MNFALSQAFGSNYLYMTNLFGGQREQGDNFFSLYSRFLMTTQLLVQNNALEEEIFNQNTMFIVYQWVLGIVISWIYRHRDSALVKPEKETLVLTTGSRVRPIKFQFYRRNLIWRNISAASLAAWWLLWWPNYCAGRPKDVFKCFSMALLVKDLSTV